MSDQSRYLCFSLGNEEYGIPLLSVKEVIGVPETTPIPQTPPHFVGIMNLRGSVISILDLRLKLGHKSQTGDETTVMILDLGDYNLGVLVDRVNSVIAVGSEEIAPKPVIESTKSTEYITGVFKKEDRLVLMLDIAKALSLQDRSVLSNASKVAA